MVILLLLTLWTADGMKVSAQEQSSISVCMRAKQAVNEMISKQKAPAFATCIIEEQSV